MNRYLQFFLGILCIISGMYLTALQSNLYKTTWYDPVGYVCFVSGLLIFTDLINKKFFSKTSVFIEKIFRWKNGKYFDILVYLSIPILILLLFGCMLLISNIVG